jgi:hypothetical protein
VGVCAVAASFAIRPEFRTILAPVGDSGGPLGALSGEFASLHSWRASTVGVARPGPRRWRPSSPTHSRLHHGQPEPVLFESRWDPRWCLEEGEGPRLRMG